MKTSKTRLDAALRSMSPGKPRAADDFWEDFRARASLVPQAKPEARPVFARPWALALAAAALAMVIFAVGQLLPDTTDQGGIAKTAPATPPQLASAKLSRVEDVQVFLDNASVTVFEDNENGGTVVFVESIALPNHT